MVNSEIMKDAKKWWRKLTHKTKWNLTINYLNHYEDLEEHEILKLYEENN